MRRRYVAVGMALMLGLATPKVGVGQSPRAPTSPRFADRHPARAPPATCRE